MHHATGVLCHYKSTLILGISSFASHPLHPILCVPSFASQPLRPILCVPAFVSHPLRPVLLFALSCYLRSSLFASRRLHPILCIPSFTSCLLHPVVICTCPPHPIVILHPVHCILSFAFHPNLLPALPNYVFTALILAREPVS